MCTGKDRMHVLYLFVLLSPKMIWWHLRCSKEYMYIYRYIYTTILYMYMYIYLYQLSCEPNHVIKPIFHLSVKIRCYPVLHITNDLKTKRLYKGIYRLQVHVQGCAVLAGPELANTWCEKHHSHGESGQSQGEEPCLQDWGPRCPALLAVCTGGKEVGGQRTSNQKS